MDVSIPARVFRNFCRSVEGPAYGVLAGASWYVCGCLPMYGVPVGASWYVYASQAVRWVPWRGDDFVRSLFRFMFRAFFRKGFVSLRFNHITFESMKLFRRVVREDGCWGRDTKLDSKIGIGRRLGYPILYSSPHRSQNYFQTGHQVMPERFQNYATIKPTSCPNYPNIMPN